MRKLKMHLHMSLDGYASDADGGFSWERTNLAAELRRAFN